MTKHQFIARFLRAIVFTTLLSRGLIYLLKISPWRNLFWYEDLFIPVVRFFGSNWIEHSNDSDQWIVLWEGALGVFLILAAITALLIKPRKPVRWMRAILFVAGLITVAHAVLEFWGMNHEHPMLFEYILQAWVPWLFLGYLKYMPDKESPAWEVPDNSLLFQTRLALCFCFLGHGCYAAGYPYQPQGFVDMLSFTFPVSYETAAFSVTFIGWMDIILAVTIFIRPLQKITLYHMAIWGLVTAGARVMAHSIAPLNIEALNPWLFETTVRFAHGLLPLFMYWLFRDVIKNENYSIVREVQGWHRRSKHAIYPTAVACVFLLTYMPLHPDFKNDTDPQARVTVREDRPVPEKIDPSLFKKAPSGKWYSDYTFQTESFPIRLEFKASDEELEPTLRKLAEVFESKDLLLSTLQQEILLNFRDAQINPVQQDFDDARILNFVPQAVMTFHPEGSLVARVHAPWLTEKTFDVWLVAPSSACSEAFSRLYGTPPLPR